MRILVAEADKVVRDQIVVALENFGNIEADVATGIEAIELARKKEYHCLFVGLDPGDSGSRDLIDVLRQSAPQRELILLATESQTKKLSQNRNEARIFSVLKKPLVPLEFYRTVSRLRKRLRTAGAV
ncbi:MAG: hypothetical protein U1E76_27655 [Planctomycetota bacterium]